MTTRTSTKVMPGWPGSCENLTRLVEGYVAREAVSGAMVEVIHLDGGSYSFARSGPGLGYHLEPGISFRWFCVIKVALAYTVLHLLTSRGMGPETPACEFLPELRGERESITVAHLLTHCSGLPSFPVGGNAASLSAAALTTRLEPGVRPGERTDYNICTAWTLVALIIERLSGRDIADALDRLMFAPLGLTDSVLTARPGDERLLTRVARLKTSLPGPRQIEALTSPSVLRRLPPWIGGLGTLTDMVRFFAYLLSVRGGETEPAGGAAETAAVMALTTGGRAAYDEGLGRMVAYAQGIMTDVSKGGFGAGWSPESFGVGGAVNGKMVMAVWAEPRLRVACGVALPAVGRLSSALLQRIGACLRADLEAATVLRAA